MGTYSVETAMGCAPSKDKKGRQRGGGPTSKPAMEIAETRPEEELVDDPSNLRPDATHIWYWEEDADRVSKHHTWDKQGNFIAYPPQVSQYIDSQYQKGAVEKQSDAKLDITYKCYNDHTGFKYSIDFVAMEQVNIGTGYRRKIWRRENPGYKVPVAMEEPPVHEATPVQEAAPETSTENEMPPPPQHLYMQLK